MKPTVATPTIYDVGVASRGTSPAPSASAGGVGVPRVPVQASPLDRLLFRPAADGADADLGPLRAALLTADDVGTACRAAVTFLQLVGYPMPAVYLAQGGRLRCHAVAGYWQVFDGMPLGAGVVGTVYRTGRPLVVPDARNHPLYVATTSDVRAQACAPVRVGHRVVGVINAEFVDDPPDGCIETLTAVGALLGEVLAGVWRPWHESPLRRLARHAVVLAGATEWTEAVDRVLDAACDLTTMSTAMLAVLDDTRPDGWQICGAVGPLMLPMAGLGAEELGQVARWVSPGTSSWTTGDERGQGLVGHEALRARGARSLAVVPLDVLGHRLGLLLVCDEDLKIPSTDEAERLELLGALAAGALRTLDAVRELGEMAARDPLTGLGHHGRFYADLRAALARRDGRTPAVLLVDVDRFKDVNDRAGHVEGDEVLRRTADALSASMRGTDRAYRIGGDEFAVIVAPPFEDDDVHAVATRVRKVVADSIAPVTVSLGWAVGTRGESPESLVGRADDALYAAKRAGRDAVSGGGDEVRRG